MRWVRSAPMPTCRPALARSALTVLLLATAVAGCGDDGDGGAARTDQLRGAALAAGLGEEVADVFALAARADSATFQVTYAGDGGAGLVVSQDPPDRRIDVVQGEVVVSSRVLHDGVAYRCEAETAEGAKPGDLTCERAAGALEAVGTFTQDALQDFIDQVEASKDELSITVDERTIADTDVTCVTTTPKAGTELDGTGPGTDVLCLSDEGAQLLVDHAGERLVADSYSTTVPKGTFDV
jgi:hypothetical protein